MLRRKDYTPFFLISILSAFMFLLPATASSIQFPDCLQCHIHKNKAAKKYVHPAYKQGCYSCHTEAHQTGSKLRKFLFAQGVDLCWGCHDKAMFTKKVKHPPVAKGMCLSCHDVHTSDNQKLLLDPMPTLCFRCHDKTKFVNKTNHPPVAAGKCTACHDVHSSESRKLLRADVPDLCFTCHEKTRYIQEFIQKRHAPVAKGMCMSCHDPHASGAEKLLRAPVPDICFTCHDEMDFKGKYTHGPVAAGMCMSCHEPHQSNTPKLTIARAPDLCFNCHDKAGFTRKNQHPPVASGLCAVCHDLHASPYPAQLRLPITDGCLQCHQKIAASPHAAGAFAEAGHPLKDRKAPWLKYGELSCASCHDPHSSDSIKLFRFPAKKGFDICINCHNNKKNR
ncbi:MAG TPA: cytochrome c3 family protein [Dissulfurispiraceae bacterium]